MEKYNRSPITIQSFSYKKMHRKIRQTILSTEKHHSWFDNRKDWATASLRYKHYRQPMWRLTTNPVIADRFTWPKSRRIVNLLSGAYRKLHSDSTLSDDSLLYMPVSSLIKTRPKLSLHNTRPLRLPSSHLTYPIVYTIPLSIYSPIPIRSYASTFTPLRGVTKDLGYLYETRSGKSTHSSDLSLKSRLLTCTSLYAFPIVSEEPKSPKAIPRLAERMYNIYANRTLEADVADRLSKSRLVSQSSGYKAAQFTASRNKTQILSKRVKTFSIPARRTTFNLYTPTINVPKTLSASIGRWSKPFLPNAPLGPGRSGITRRRNLDDAETTSYIGLPKHSLKVHEKELASYYKPQVRTTTDLHTQSCMTRISSSSSFHRRCATRSEAIPVDTDIALRLRLGCHISSTGMDYLYPKSAPLKVTPVEIKKHIRIPKYSAEELEMKANPTTVCLLRAQRLLKNTKITSFSSPPIRQPIKPINKVILRPLPSERRFVVNNDHLYPSSPPKVVTAQFSIRPLPGSDLKLRPTRLRPKIDLEDEDFADAEFFPTRRLLSSANNYSQLYVSHPETLRTEELGHRLKLSLRSSTSKIASLYASHPVNPVALVPARHRKRPEPQPSRNPKIPEKYSADAYVPRPGIVKTSSRVHCILHGIQ